MTRETVTIGRIRESSYGKSQKCDVEIEIKDIDNGKELFISAGLWNTKLTDYTECGQMQDTIRKAIMNFQTVNGVTRNIPKYPNEPYFKELYKSREDIIKLLDIWDRYHLNAVHPDCEHQRAQNWGHEDLIMVHYVLKDEILEKQQKLNEKIKTQLAQDGHIELTKEERAFFNLPHSINLSAERLGSIGLEYYREKSRKTEKSGLVYEYEHPNGVLGKPCSICGYKYGTTWNYGALPQDVIDFVNKFEGNA